MPKVTKKTAAADDLLQPAASMMDIEAGTEEAPHAAEGAGGGAAPKPKFPPLSSYEQNGKRIEFRRVPVPQHRMTPLKNNWLALYKPVTENLKLDMRMNLKTRKVGLQELCMQQAVGRGKAAGRQRRPTVAAAGVICLFAGCKACVPNSTIPDGDGSWTASLHGYGSSASMPRCFLDSPVLSASARRCEQR